MIDGTTPLPARPLDLYLTTEPATHIYKSPSHFQHPYLRVHGFIRDRQNLRESIDAAYYQRYVELPVVITTNIPCDSCKKTYHIDVREETIREQSRYPFPILVMHTWSWGKRQVHSLIAYIDKDGKCRHTELLDGNRVFITPYIVYNPDMLNVYMYRSKD